LFLCRLSSSVLFQAWSPVKERVKLFIVKHQQS